MVWMWRLLQLNVDPCSDVANTLVWMCDIVICSGVEGSEMES